MGKVISLGHRLLENEFEKNLTAAMREIKMISQQDPSFNIKVEQIRAKYADVFLKFRNNIISLGYGYHNFCECADCTANSNVTVDTEEPNVIQ